MHRRTIIVAQRLIQIRLLLQHLLLCYQVQILHETLALMMLRLLIRHVYDLSSGSFKLFGARTDLFHVLCLLLILHDLPLLALLTVDLVLLLDDEVLILLRKVFFLEIQVHTL